MFRFNLKSLFWLSVGALLAVDPPAAFVFARAKQNEINDDSDGLTVADQFKIPGNSIPYVPAIERPVKSLRESKDNKVEESLKFKKEARDHLSRGRRNDKPQQLIEYSLGGIEALNKAYELNPNDRELMDLMVQAKGFLGSHYYSMSLEAGTVRDTKKWVYKSIEEFNTLKFNPNPDAISKMEQRAASLGLWGIGYYDSAKNAESNSQMIELNNLAIKDLKLSLNDYNQVLQYKNNNNELILNKATTNFYFAMAHFNVATIEKDPRKISANHLEIIKNLNTAADELQKTLEAYARLTTMQDDPKVVSYVAFSYYFLGVINDIYARTDVAQQKRYYELAKKHYQKAYVELEKAEKIPYVSGMLEDIKQKKEHCKKYIESTSLTFNNVAFSVAVALAFTFGGLKALRDRCQTEEQIEPEEKHQVRSKKTKSTSTATRPPPNRYRYFKKKPKTTDKPNDGSELQANGSSGVIDSKDSNYDSKNSKTSAKDSSGAMDSKDPKKDPKTSRDAEEKTLNPGSAAADLAVSKVKKQPITTLSKNQKKLAREARARKRERFAESNTTPSINPKIDFQDQKELPKPKPLKRPPTQIQVIGSKQLELRLERKKAQDDILKKQKEKLDAKEQAKQEVIQRELDNKNKELEAIRVKETEEKAKFEALQKIKKAAEEKIKIERELTLKQHFDYITTRLKEKQESDLKKDAKSAANSATDTVESYKKDLQRTLAARIKMVERRLGSSAGSASSTTQISKQINMSSPHISKPINQSSPQPFIPPRVNLFFKDGLVVHQVPDVFKAVANELCAYQEETGRKFYLTGGAARKFILALQNPDLPIFIDDLDILTGAEVKVVNSLFDPASGVIHTTKVNLKDVSQLKSHSGSDVSFRHSQNLKDSKIDMDLSNRSNQTRLDLKEDSVRRDTTINALYIEFVRVGSNLKAIIHDPTGFGLKHLLNIPPVVAFYGDKKSKISEDPLHIIRMVYQRVKLQGIILKEDLELIKAILVENPNLFKTHPKISQTLDWWMAKKFNRLPSTLRGKVYRDLNKLGISQHFPDVLKRKYQSWLKLPVEAAASSITATNPPAAPSAVRGGAKLTPHQPTKS